jgi:hypothetical protein
MAAFALGGMTPRQPPAAEQAPRAKVLYSAAMSLDGFIAGPGGDASWMTEYLGPNPTVDELVPPHRLSASPTGGACGQHSPAPCSVTRGGKPAPYRR